MKQLSGWVVRHPYYLASIPQERSDLLSQIEIECDSEIHDFYPTEAEAVQRLRQYLTEQREQALRDLKLVSMPGIRWQCPQQELDEWRKEDTRLLEIADRGLVLFPEMR